MEYVLFYLCGIMTVLGLIGVINFVISKTALKTAKEQSQAQHVDAIAHWERLEDVWNEIANSISKLRKS